MSRLLQVANIDHIPPKNEENTLLHHAVHRALAVHYHVNGFAKMVAHILPGEIEATVGDLVVECDNLTQLEMITQSGWIKVIRKPCREQIVDSGARYRHCKTAFEGIIERYLL
jgi:hypothetical protein